MGSLKQKNLDLQYLELITLILLEKKAILIISLLGLLIGLLIAFTTPKEYNAATIMLSESEDMNQSFGQMGALAGLAGFSIPQMNATQASISPEMFPEIIGSKDFLLKLMKEKFLFESFGREMTLEEYYVEERPANVIQKSINFVVGIPSRIVGAIAKDKEVAASSQVEAQESLDLDQFTKVSPQENYVISQLRKRIEIEVDKKIITVKVSMPEPLVAAQANVLVLDDLIDFITEYRTAKQGMNFSLISESVDEAETKFIEAQNKLATFRDMNQGIISQRARTKEEQLQAEFNIAFNVFNTLRQELEQANIQLKRGRPVFTILEKATVPLAPSIPNKPLIIVFSVFLGLFFGLIYSVLKIILNSLNNSTAI